MRKELKPIYATPKGETVTHDSVWEKFITTEFYDKGLDYTIQAELSMLVVYVIEPFNSNPWG